MTREPPAILWFRRDLRLDDNPALLAAAAGDREVIAVYILDKTPNVRPPGAASRWWLERSLRALSRDLEALGGRLILRRGVAADVLQALAAETGAGSLHWNRLYDGASIARDAGIKAMFKAQGLACHSHNGALLNEPWEVTSGSGAPYTVFTPYWRAAARTAGSKDPYAKPAGLRAPAARPCSDRLETWRLSPSAPDWSAGFVDWTPGEAGARTRLDLFLAGGVDDYAKARDNPGVNGTSRLSPHLAFGEIGPRRVWSLTQAALRNGASTRGAETFLKELGWREFSYHILFHHPRIERENFKPAFDTFPWRDDESALQAWRRGRTGYPIVDAGMRELWSTGWMHNRVRMIVGSFLIKDLMIDWRRGEAWFWDTLVDADIANNVASWQWVAGSGADAAPYFRVFNPVLQGEKFDPDGAYVRRWLPELAGLPSDLIHQPWRADPGALTRAAVKLGVHYPERIIDHGFARDRALDAFKGLSA